MSPSSRVGPEPVHIPVTGHNIYVELAVTGTHDAMLHGFRAEVTERAPLDVDGVSITPYKMPDMILSQDLVEPNRRAVENFRPLEKPHDEVLLDVAPPLVRPALDEDSAEVRPPFPLPLVLHPCDGIRLVFAPVTEDRRHIRWRLSAVVECGGNVGSPSWELQVTAETTYKSFHPGGEEPGFVPVHGLAPQHWDVKYALGTGA